MQVRFALAAALLAMLTIPLRAAAEVHSKQRHSPLEVLVLGSGGPRAFGRAATSYLVLVDGTPRILVDAGPGAFLEMGKLGVDLAKVDIVLLTHLHIDHSGDIPAIFLDRALTADRPIHFKVFGPEGGGLFPSTSQFMKSLFAAGGVYQYETTFGAEQTIDSKDLPAVLNFAESQIFADGDLHVREIATHHGDCPSVAYRVDYHHHSVTFSGDMDASALANLQGLALDSDLLIFHVGVLDPPNSPKILYTLHTPPREIGQAARDARVRHLLLSHLSPAIEENRRQVLQSIAKSYRHDIQFAYDGMRVRASEAKQ